MQAAAYNAKYGFNHLETRSYEEVTAPLRRLLIKDATYKWDKKCETSFQTLLRMMNSRTYLAPHDPKRKTHLVTDASLCGIANSLYQEDDQCSHKPLLPLYNKMPKAAPVRLPGTETRCRTSGSPTSTCRGSPCPVTKLPATRRP